MRSRACWLSVPPGEHRPRRYYRLESVRPGPLAGAAAWVRRGGRHDLAAAQSRRRWHLHGHFDLPGLYGQRKAPFGAHSQAEHDRFADAFGGLFPGAALADAPGNGWALGHPHPVFIPVDSHEEPHRRPSSTDGPSASPAPMTRAATWQPSRACVIPARARKLHLSLRGAPHDAPPAVRRHDHPRRSGAICEQPRGRTWRTAPAVGAAAAGVLRRREMGRSMSSLRTRRAGASRAAAACARSPIARRGRHRAARRRRMSTLPPARDVLLWGSTLRRPCCPPRPNAHPRRDRRARALQEPRDRGTTPRMSSATSPPVIGATSAGCSRPTRSAPCCQG